MSGEIWFLFLMFGLKVPVIGIGYFLYRVLRAQEDEWEHMGWDEGPPDDGGGGGGGGEPLPRAASAWRPREEARATAPSHALGVGAHARPEPAAGSAADARAATAYADALAK